jgi:very-short-patch-repair endonuclease
VSLARVFSVARKLDLPAPEREYRFDPERRWRFDFAWPSLKIAVEIEGGVWIRGRHVRPVGYLGDLEKYNRAVVLGWRVLRYAPHQLGQLEHDLRALLAPTEQIE